MSNLTTPEGVKTYMSQAANQADWNNRCDAVKAANGGDYPPFWYREIILSGLCDATITGGSRITITSLAEVEI